MNFKTVSIIGLGYIGLPTAALIASKKIHVKGVDSNEKVINTINEGKIHIIEPGLEKIVSIAVKDNFLSASSKPSESDVFIIAVPTPFKKESNNKSIPICNLRHVKSAAKSIAKVLKKGDLILLESTSPVGTTEKLSNWLQEDRPDLVFPNTGSEISDIHIAYCPERVLPGNIMYELVHNNRVMGGITNKCTSLAVEFYKLFVKGECISTNSRTAEMTKLSENSFRDINIAYANELSIVCEKLNIDVWELIKLSNLHPRVNILEPGPGVGGHCIAVDPWFIAQSAPKNTPLIQTARAVNDFKPEWIIKKTLDMVKKLSNNNMEEIIKINIVCYGLTFKPNIDDMRESPSYKIASKLSKLHQGNVYAVEPNIRELPDNNLKLISIKEAKAIADISLMLVDHDEFINSTPPSKIIIDTKGIWK